MIPPHREISDSRIVQLLRQRRCNGQVAERINLVSNVDDELHPPCDELSVDLIDNEYPDLAVILEAEYERPDDDIP